MNWPRKRRAVPREPRLPHARPVTDAAIAAAAAPVPFACASCGRRTDAPAGDWDPPVCPECDAALNFEELELELGFHDRDDEA